VIAFDIKIVKVMYFDEPADGARHERLGPLALLGVSAVASRRSATSTGWLGNLADGAAAALFCCLSCHPDRIRRTDGPPTWTSRANAVKVPGGYWLVADRQSEGRGRRGAAGSTRRALQADGGQPAAERSIAGEPSVAAMATYEVVVNHLRAQTLVIKWPNDLMLAGAKLSGSSRTS
jgi:hypothetical protein